jgi:hypothetical protein
LTSFIGFVKHELANASSILPFWGFGFHNVQIKDALVEISPFAGPVDGKSTCWTPKAEDMVSDRGRAADRRTDK